MHNEMKPSSGPGHKGNLVQISHEKTYLSSGICAEREVFSLKKKLD